MPIKNYTTEIDAFRSIGEIQGALATHGASKIMLDYNAGEPVSVAFCIETPNGLRGFKLPANVGGVRGVFAQQRSNRSRDRRSELPGATSETGYLRRWL